MVHLEEALGRTRIADSQGTGIAANVTRGIPEHSMKVAF